MFEKLKGIKNIEFILLVLAAGVLAFVLTQPGDSSGASTQEERLAGILCKVEGAGRVEVFLAYGEAPAESIFAFSGQSQSAQNDITGVIIVADGADNPDIKLRLMQAAKTALGIDSARISVLKRAQEGK